MECCNFVVFPWLLKLLFYTEAMELWSYFQSVFLLLFDHHEDECALLTAMLLNSGC